MLVRKLSGSLHISGGPGGTIVTLEFELTGELPDDLPPSVAVVAN